MTEFLYFRKLQFIKIQNVCTILIYLLIFVDMDQFVISLGIIHSFRSLMNQSLEMFQRPSLHRVLTIRHMMPEHKIKGIFPY